MTRTKQRTAHTVAPLEEVATTLLSVIFGFLTPHDLALFRTVSVRFREVRAAWSHFVVSCRQSVTVLQHLADRMSIKEVQCLYPIDLDILRDLRLHRVCVNLDMAGFSMGSIECYPRMLKDLAQYPVRELRLHPVSCREGERLCFALPGLETIEFCFSDRCATFRLPRMRHLKNLTLRADDDEFEVEGLDQNKQLRTLRAPVYALRNLSSQHLQFIELWLNGIMSVKLALSRLNHCPLLDSIELHDACSSECDDVDREPRCPGKLIPCKFLSLFDCDDDDLAFLSLVPRLRGLTITCKCTGEYQLSAAEVGNLKCLTQLRSLRLNHANMSQSLTELQTRLPGIEVLYLTPERP